MKRFDLRQIMRDAHRTYKYVNLKECGMPLYNGEGKLKSNRTVFRVIGE